MTIVRRPGITIPDRIAQMRHDAEMLVQDAERELRLWADGCRFETMTHVDLHMLSVKVERACEDMDAIRDMVRRAGDAAKVEGRQAA